MVRTMTGTYTEFGLLRSDQALPCHREINCEQGGATVYCVVLADGFIVDCGSGYYGKQRSELLAAAVNASNPSQFAFGRKPGAA